MGVGELVLSLTFKVDDVEQATASLSPANDWEKLIADMCGVLKLEGFSGPMPDWTPIDRRGSNAFIEAINTAYDKHYPLVLSPDAVWLLIAQGFARHVNENAEKLRNLFVEHEGKKTLKVRRDDFVKGSLDINAWPEVFGEFSEQIRNNTGPKLHDLLSPTFTTTGRVEKAAADVVLMDTMKKYFEYVLLTMCGIPEITLEGTLEDWKQLRDRAVALAEFDLEWWITELTPVLDQFVAAASGKPDQKFWSKMYKEAHGSGGPFIRGWIITFFPYLIRNNGVAYRNPHLTTWSQKEIFGGVQTSDLAIGVSKVPFIWEYYDKEIPMHFYAGFMGIAQHQTSLAIQPLIGWAVADDKPEELVTRKNFLKDMLVQFEED